MTRKSLVALLACVHLAGGCVFRDVREQQQKIDALCLLQGTVAGAGRELRPIVVVLARKVPVDAAAPRGWRIVDHFVLEHAGRWIFAAPPGEYGLAAFEDANRDLVYQPGEPYVEPGATPVTCAEGARIADIAVVIPEVPTGRADTVIDIAALQARGIEGQVRATLGQLTVAGEIARLTDERFSGENAESGLWRPFDFLVSWHACVYFLEADDPRKTPVLFVHGVNGTPASFDYLIERLDRARFQPWVYHYPSGAHLDAIADHLTQTIASVQRRYPHERVIVVAHSMGGLVARGFILRHAQAAGAGRIPLFVTISTPWEGHRAAELGVKTAPAVVRVWEDIAPGSDYLRSLQSRLPEGTAHHLLFTFNRKSTSFGVSDDQSVSVASQLGAAAQANAERLYGFDDTHVGVLRNAEASALLNRLLDRAR